MEARESDISLPALFTIFTMLRTCFSLHFPPLLALHVGFQHMPSEVEVNPSDLHASNQV